MLTTMVKIYANLIEAGYKTINDVPASLRPLVEAELASRQQQGA